MSKKQKAKETIERSAQRFTDPKFDDYIIGNEINIKEHRDMFLSPDCPVRPIGTDRNNKNYIYMTRSGKIIDIARDKHNQQAIIALFDDCSAYLLSRFPQWRKIKTEDGETKIEPAPDRFNLQRIQRLLMHEAARKGPVKIHEIERRAGAWEHGGDLYLHHGDRVSVYSAGVESEPYIEPLGLIDEFAYSRDERGTHLPYKIKNGEKIYYIPDPDENEARDAAAEIIEYIASWKWRREALDPQLLFGFLLAATFGGALEWRSSSWIYGASGAGKSTWLNFAEAFFMNSCERNSQPTQASVRNEIASSAITAIIDEARTDGRIAIEGLIDLMRYSAGSDKLMIAKPDQTTTSFAVRSTFMFCGVNIPIFDDQDISRLTVFNLKNIPAEADEPPNFIRTAELSSTIRYFIARRWREFQSRKAHYEKYLQQKGLSKREQAQLSAPMTFAAWFAYESPTPTKEEIDAYFPDIVAAHRQHRNIPDYEICFEILQSSKIDIIDERGMYTEKYRRTVSFVIDCAIQDNYPIAMMKGLEEHGMKLIERGDNNYFLFIANNHTALAAIFRNTRYTAGERSGLWNNYLKEMPKAIDESRQRLVGGSPVRGIEIPLTDYHVKKIL